MSATLSDKHLQPTPSGNLIPGYVAVDPHRVGRHSYISEFCHIAQHTEIGNYCSIGNLCTIGAQKHPMNYLTTFPFDEIVNLTERKWTVVGSDVWVGCNTVIMMGVTVGHGAVIGAGAVVTKDVPPYAIVAGVPSKVLKYRFTTDVITGLLETHWWDLPAEEVKKLPIHDPVKCVEEIRKLTASEGRA